MNSDNGHGEGRDDKRNVNFIRHIIDDDLRQGKHGGRVVTRFPPEPNGYLHIGHAKSICLNFGIAKDYGGVCNLRFDDTNPEKESAEFVEAIKQDVAWLGFSWGDNAHYASDYFEFLFDSALKLIDDGKAYVDEQNADEIRANRGTLTEAGVDSPWRNRPAEESRDLFLRMRAGEFADGERVLRAKIDMSSANMIMRDPVLYRVRHVHHQRTGDAWCIYPMYDFTHCLSDAHESVTHSLCTLEFEDNRAIYDWVLDNVGFDDPPRQYEFSRLNLEYAVLSKRYLTELVSNGLVDGWDDPRMPTLRGLRRRGYPAAAIREFCDRIGVTKSENVIEMGVLESAVRDNLNANSPRAMAVLRPLKLVIENLDADHVEMLEVPNHPVNADLGTRRMPFTRELFIERDDFMEDPPKKFFRLGPGREVRLRYAYCVTCTEVVKDADGEVVELRARYDPETGGGKTPDGRKVKGIIHWVSASEGKRAHVRLYDRLFNVPNPLADRDATYTDHLNPDSLEVIDNAVIEPGLQDAPADAKFQFERLGYFVVDGKDSRAGHPVFNRTVGLRDTWAKQSGKPGGKR